MSAVRDFRRWASASIPRRHAVEVPLQAAGGMVADSVHGARFIVVGIDDAPLPLVARAIESYRGARYASRLCLAGRHESLNRINDAGLADGNVALMLDGVAADTPLSELISDRIEAVRFDSTFVILSGRELRIGLVLKSMLGLAHELGLCSLGEPMAASNGCPTARFEFDFVPVPPLQGILASEHFAARGDPDADALSAIARLYP